MDKISFVHLSDIHFKKESDMAGDIDRDLRDSIIYDIEYRAKVELENIQGLLIGGDIAFSGVREEYEKAQEFIDKLVGILNVEKYDVYCVPGNHDVNRTVVDKKSFPYENQCKIDQQTTIDSADDMYRDLIHRGKYSDMLYDPIEEYNEFAEKYECNLSSERPYWIKEFCVGEAFKIYMQGINSCLISNGDDGDVKYRNSFRPMYIGQSMIPPKFHDKVTIILCHHPIECWKFKEELVSKVDKRADIQLYGHKHMQTVDFSNQRLILTAGAVHPVRGKDWIPRYNWLTLEHEVIEGENIVRIKVYPRVLSEDREGFIAETENETGKIYLEYTVNISKKRKEQDSCLKKRNRKDMNEHIDSNYEKPGSCENMNDEDGSKSSNYEEAAPCDVSEMVDRRKLVYMFFSLSFPDQTKVLSKFELLDEEDRDRKYRDILGDILDKAAQRGILQKFYRAVTETGG